MDRLWKLENEQGYEVYSVWECDFRNQPFKIVEAVKLYENFIDNKNVFDIFISIR